MENRMKDFLKCGAAGWCMEIIFTSLVSLASGDRRLVGKTSLFMFPIYGMGAFLGPFCRSLDRHLLRPGKTDPADRLLRHGLRDMALIFTAEYVTGRLLRSLRACPGITPAAGSAWTVSYGWILPRSGSWPDFCLKGSPRENNFY